MTTQDYRAFVVSKSQIDARSGFAPTYHNPAEHDFQSALIDWACQQGRGAVFADCGLGKAQPITEPVLTPKGWVPIGSLSVGDDVIAGDGSPTKVIGVFPQGDREVAEVVFSDGARARCDWDHLWTVRSENDVSRGRPWRIMTLRQVADAGLFAAASRPTKQWRIPTCGAVEMAERGFAIPPYVLGVLLGDGSFRCGDSLSFTTVDPEIVAFVEAETPAPLRVVKFGGNARVPSFRISREKAGTGHPNPFVAALRDFGLWGLYSHAKFVPAPYLVGSVSQRLALLQGLMDTDGTVARDGTIQFGSSSSALVEAMVSLVRSLGGIARVTAKMPTYVHKGERRDGREHWTVTIALPNGITPFRLSRKIERCKGRVKYLPVRKIAAINQVGREEAVCIAIEHPSRLYITRDFVVTHNTLMQLVWAENVHRHTNKPSLIIAPLSVSSQTVDEAAKFDMQAVRVMDGKAPAGVGIVTTNYERLHHFDPDDFGGVVCDESSILKNFDGALKARITEFLRRVEFRGLYTATPSPNDHIELGTSSEALGHLGYMDMLGTFFKNDEGNLHPAFIGTKWRFKAHAERDFWRWVSSWARALRKPSDLGFDDRHWVLPELREVEHEIASDATAGFLFPVPARGLSEEREERKATVRQRCEKAAELLAASGCGVSWCHLNEEADLITGMVPGAVNLSGSDKDEVKEEKFRAFRRGEIRHLVTKPKIAAFGVNWQHCHTATYFTDYSFEQYYQAVRRFWRFGQAEPVTIHNISTQSLSHVAQSRKAKAAAAEEMFRQMVKQMNDALTLKRYQEHTGQMEVPAWL